MNKLQKFAKVKLGVIASVIGTALFFFGITPFPDELVEYTMIVAGVLLILAYCFLSRDWFKRNLGWEAQVLMLAPPLTTLGVLAIYQALTAAWLVPRDSTIQIFTGSALIIISLILLSRGVKYVKL